MFFGINHVNIQGHLEILNVKTENNSKFLNFKSKNLKHKFGTLNNFK